MRWDDQISGRLRLRDLHTLVTVARKGSMAKAAQELAVTQPAVSKAIASMEHTFGLRLLERKARGIEPTVYGRALLKWGNAVFEDLRQAVKEMQSLADPDAGEVLIGATGPMVVGLLPAAIDRVSRQYPRIVPRVTQRYTTAEQYESLRARRLDFVVGRVSQAFAEDDLRSEVLFPEPLYVVAGAKSKWARRRRVQLCDLVNEPWVMPTPETAVGAFAAQVFKSAGLPFPSYGVTSNSLPLSRALVATGRYLGMFPGSFWHFSGRRAAVKVLPVKVPLEAPPVGIVTLRERMPSPVAKVFMENLRAVAKPLNRAL